MPRTPQIPKTRDSGWMTPLEAAEHLGVSIKTIRKAYMSEGMQHAKLGHSMVRLRREWVDAWAEGRAVGRVVGL